VLTGDITLAIADIDMVKISLRALITSLSRTTRSGTAEEDG
jgi:Gas vesicle protein